MGAPERVGDYFLFSPFAQGGMASIHLGRLVRTGFQRVVVVKRLHRAEASRPGAAERMLREAHLSSRIHSPYVVPTIDVIQEEGELCLVMDLVRGVTLGRLVELAEEAGRPLPLPIVATIFGDFLRGLHAAHEATDEDGSPLYIVHRDVAPRNVLVGLDGIGRVLDFGIAKALGHRSMTTTGDVRGTLAYMAPELLRGERSITRHADLYSIGVLLWETVTGSRFVGGADAPVVPTEERLATPPSRLRPDLGAALDAVVLRALRPDPTARFGSAEEMALALEAALGTPAPRDDVTRTVERLALDDLDALAARVRECEAYRPSAVPPPRSLPPPPAPEAATVVAVTAPADGAAPPTRERRGPSRPVVAAVVAVAGAATLLLLRRGPEPVASQAATAEPRSVPRAEVPPPQPHPSTSAAAVPTPSEGLAATAAPPASSLPLAASDRGLRSASPRRGPAATNVSERPAGRAPTVDAAAVDLAPKASNAPLLVAPPPAVKDPTAERM